MDSDFLFVTVGVVALIGGGVTLVAALRRHKANHPAGVAMLIAGMMVTAFGLLLTGFAIAYAMAEPLAAEPAP
jgi:uncharacterized membrane protein HdeD (DUF308 family)